MFAIVAGPLPVPDGVSGEDFEAQHAKRDPAVVSKEAGCMLYQLVKTKTEQYYMMELYSDKEALDTHFKNMGAKNGAPALEKLKPDGMLKIFPVCSAILKEGTGTIANVIKLPVKDGSAFEAAALPAMMEYDRDEAGTKAYILAKSLDNSIYYFLEIFQDQAAIDFHSKSAAFKGFNKKLGPALKDAPGGKPDFSLAGMALAGGSTPRKVNAAKQVSKL